MRGKKENSLIVIENGTLKKYCLDDKLSWELGRLSKDTAAAISYGVSGGDKNETVEGNINYRLDLNRLNVHTALKKGYANLEVYKEATDIIISKLNEGL